MAACAPRWPSRSGSPAPRQASRAWPARAAARRCPESCSGSWIRARSTASRRGCRRARRSSRRPTARRRPPRWSRGSSSRRCGWRTTAPARTSSPASPPRSSPPGTPSWGCSRWTRRRCRRWRGASRRARCRSATSFATSSTATASSSCVAERWREMARALPADATLVANGDDPQLGEIASQRPGSVVFGLDDPRHASPDAAARGRLEVVRPLRDAVRLRRRLHRASRRLPVPGLRPRPATARDRGAGDRAERARERLVLARAAGGLDARRAAGARALQRLQRARRSLVGSCARRLRSTSIGAGLQGFSAAFGRFERIQLDERSLLMLLIKNPAGANEVVRTLVAGGAPRAAARRAERRDRRRPRRLLDLGRRLRAAPRLARAPDRNRRARRRARAALQVRGPARRARSRSFRRSTRRSTAGSS